MTEKFNVLVKDVENLSRALTKARTSQMMINGSPQVNTGTYLSAYYSLETPLFKKVMDNKPTDSKPVDGELRKNQLPYIFNDSKGVKVKNLKDSTRNDELSEREVYRKYLTSISSDYLRLASYIYSKETSLKIADVSRGNSFSFGSVRKVSSSRPATDLDIIEYKANFLTKDVSNKGRDPEDLSCYKIVYITDENDDSFLMFNLLMVANKKLGFDIKTVTVEEFENGDYTDHFILVESDVNEFLSQQSNVPLEIKKNFKFGSGEEVLVVSDFYYEDASGNKYVNKKTSEISDNSRSLIDGKYFILSEDFFDLFMKSIQMSISLVGVVNDGDHKRTFTTVDVISFCMATTFDLQYPIEVGSVLSSGGILNKHFVNLTEYKRIIHDSVSELMGGDYDDVDSGMDSNYDEFRSDITLITDLGKSLELAKESGRYNGCMFRDVEINSIINGLEKYNRNNVVVVGESGVGISTLLFGLTEKIIDGGSAKLSGRPLYLVNYQEIISGTRLRGEFEDRINKIKKEAVARNAIVVIEDIGTSDNDNGNLETIKSQLSKNVSLIMISSNKDFIKHQAFFKNFVRVSVEPLSVEQSVEVLLDWRSIYEEFHNVSFSNSILSQIVDLSDRYISSQKLPYKALNLMDLVGAKKSDLGLSEQVDINIDDVVEVLAKISKIDKSSIHITEISDGVDLDLSISKQIIGNLDTKLRSSIFGQDNAVDAVVSSILVARSGLGDNTKPMASFLFVGPTGVGKTELVKVMAKELSMNLVRIDMSEYMDKTSVNKLIGSSAGYVGYGDGGLLTNQVFNNPNSIILLDEVEKGHPDVLNIFLQILDNGVATDGSGNAVSFKNCIIVMTSNAGVKKTVDEKNVIAFSGTSVNPNDSRKSGINMEQVEKTFSPEFRNRIDMIVEFNYINKDSIDSIINKSLEILYEKVKMYGVDVKIGDDVMSLIREKGYNRDLGARPLYRYVKDNIIKNVAKVLMSEKIIKGDTIETFVIDGEIFAKLSKKVKPAKKAKSLKVEVERVLN